MANAAGAVMARRVRRVWSRPDSIGVEFLEPERELAARRRRDRRVAERL